MAEQKPPTKYQEPASYAQRITPEHKTALDHLFSYQPADTEQTALYGEINAAARQFAHVVLECCPASADRSAAIRQIREARMTANASIACEGVKLP